MIFSIIIPVCNGEKYLEKCVGSALLQSDSFDGDKYEILIVENGSTDNTPQLADELSKKHENIRCIHRGRIGLFAARQEGILEAKGDYIVSLDADDMLAEGALSELRKALDKINAAGKKADMLIFRAAELTEEGQGKLLHKKLLEDEKLYEGSDKEELYQLFAQGDSINSMWTKCVRRSIAAIDHDGIFINNGEDLYQTAVYLERAQAIAYIDKALYLYRRAGVSMTSSYNPSYIEDQKKVWAQMDRFLENRNNKEYDKWVDERKSLTCSIMVASIVYSGIGIGNKKKALDKTFDDELFVKYGKRELPKWAPEEPVFIHELIVSDNAKKLLLATARKHDIKVFIKGIRNKIFGSR